MARELKTADLNIRIRPSTKRLLARLAEDDDLSVSALIERLVKAEAARRRGTR